MRKKTKKDKKQKRFVRKQNVLEIRKELSFIRGSLNTAQAFLLGANAYAKSLDILRDRIHRIQNALRRLKVI